MSKLKNILIGVLTVPIVIFGAIVAIPSWRDGIKDTIAKDSSIYKEQSEKLSEINGSYDLIHSQLTKNQKLLNDQQSQIEELTKQQTILSAQLADVTIQKEEAIKTIAEAEKDIEICATAISTLNEQKTQLEANAEANAEQIANLNIQLSARQEELEIAQSNLASANSKIVEFQFQIDELNKEIEKLNGSSSLITFTVSELFSQIAFSELLYSIDTVTILNEDTFSYLKPFITGEKDISSVNFYEYRFIYVTYDNDDLGSVMQDNRYGNCVKINLKLDDNIIDINDVVIKNNIYDYSLTFEMLNENDFILNINLFTR